MIYRHFEMDSLLTRLTNSLLLRIAVTLVIFYVLFPGQAKADDLNVFDTAEAAVENEQYQLAQDLLTGWLVQHPEDFAARYLRARVLSWSERWQAALNDYHYLLQNDPGNTDYMLGSAQVFLWQGKPDAALEILESALSLSPDYQDLWRLQLQALQASNKPGSHEKAMELADQAELRFPGADWIELAQSRIRGRTYSELAAGFSHANLDNGFANWTDTFLDARFPMRDGRVIYGGVRATDRFGVQDQEAKVGVYLPIGTRWMSQFETTLGPDDGVLPQRSFSVGVTRTLPSDWSIGVTLRHMSYELTTSNVVSLAVDRFWRGYRFAYKLHRGDTESAQVTYSHELRGEFFYHEQSFVGLILADGRESESLGGSQLITTDVTAVVLHGLHWFRPDWGFSWALSQHEQGNLYRRKEINVGLRYRL